MGKIIAKSETLKVRLSCKACHAEERATFHSIPFHSTPPPSQLRFRSFAKYLITGQALKPEDVMHFNYDIVVNPIENVKI